MGLHLYLGERGDLGTCSSPLTYSTLIISPPTQDGKNTLIHQSIHVDMTPFHYQGQMREGEMKVKRLK